MKIPLIWILSTLIVLSYAGDIIGVTTGTASAKTGIVGTSYADLQSVRTSGTAAAGISNPNGGKFLTAGGPPCRDGTGQCRFFTCTPFMTGFAPAVTAPSRIAAALVGARCTIPDPRIPAESDEPPRSIS